MEKLKLRLFTEANLKGTSVLYRPDINSPIGPNGGISNLNRLEKNARTLKKMLDMGAKVGIIAHQGDTLDYQNLGPMSAHAQALTLLTGYPVKYLDDVCGPAAQDAVRNLQSGEAILLGNLRYLTEEVSSFEKEVKLTPQEMTKTWLMRSLTPLFDIYVNDAFSAAHRSSVSMVGFELSLPTYCGYQLYEEYEALFNLTQKPLWNPVFLLGGAKISDAFSMMRQALEQGYAKTILTAGVTGIVFLIASGIKFSDPTMVFLHDRDLLSYIREASTLIEDFGERIKYPVDLAYVANGQRNEIDVFDPAFSELKVLFTDIGQKTSDAYCSVIKKCGMCFSNGPAGCYEDAPSSLGTKLTLQAIAASSCFSVIGGGDTVSAASYLVPGGGFSYICTAGGAMVRFLSGKKLPLISALEEAYDKWIK